MNNIANGWNRIRLEYAEEAALEQQKGRDLAREMAYDMVRLEQRIGDAVAEHDYLAAHDLELVREEIMFTRMQVLRRSR